MDAVGILDIIKKRADVLELRKADILAKSELETYVPAKLAYMQIADRLSIQIGELHMVVGLITNAVREERGEV